MDGGALDEGRNLTDPERVILGSPTPPPQVSDVFCPNLKVGSQNNRARSYPSLLERVVQELLGMALNKGEQ